MADPNPCCIRSLAGIASASDNLTFPCATCGRSWRWDKGWWEVKATESVRHLRLLPPSGSDDQEART